MRAISCTLNRVFKNLSEELQAIRDDLFTSHIFLSLKYHECISTMFLLLLVWLFVLMSVNNNPNLRTVVSMISRLTCPDTCSTYSFDSAIATEFALEILLRSIITESCDNESLESIASDVGIF